ncbi:inactive phospholipase C-like protein 2, partial [Limulus polyphemus]|uniref:Phosphoinositide phospholipase C n=1 Tax=Limulus polyphemus TaxID=6850 RepID=A0ABM1THH4_LIMPO
TFIKGSKSHEIDGSFFGSLSQSHDIDGSSFDILSQSHEIDGSSFDILSQSHNIDGSFFGSLSQSHEIDGSSFDILSQSHEIDGSFFVAQREVFRLTKLKIGYRGRKFRISPINGRKLRISPINGRKFRISPINGRKLRISPITVPIRCIHEVRAGKTTELLRRKDIAGGYDEACAFSIIFGSRYKSVDLIASSADEANIWISGLSVLIGGYKASGGLTGQQIIRERWLHSAFHQSNRDGQGTLDDKETIALVKKLNNHMNSVSVRQKIMELNVDKMGQDRGRLNSCQFISLFKSTSTRPEIYFLLVRYSGKDYMTTEDFHLFLEGEQGVYGVTADECRRLIEKYEPSEESKRKHQLLIDGFTRFLLSEDCDIMSPTHQTVCQDMSLPLSQYFISTSSTLLLHQNRDCQLSAGEEYAKALKFGCRSLTVDCWDGEDEPMVSRLVSPATDSRLSQVLDAISRYAFEFSDYPLIIHLQNHCSLQGQLQVVSLIQEKLGNQLLLPNRHGNGGEFKMSPEDLRRKILLKGKILPEYCLLTGEVSEDEDIGEIGIPCKKFKKIQLRKELSDLIVLHHINFTDFRTAHQI